MTTFRKATIDDIPRVSDIYENIHGEEEAGNLHIGWERGVYPTRATALAALNRGELFVAEIAQSAPAEQPALNRGELFVAEISQSALATQSAPEAQSALATQPAPEAPIIAASAIINKDQHPVYAQVNWECKCEADKVLVMHTLAVDPAFARRGIGGDFLKFYEELARQMNCQDLRIDTQAHNKIARSLYKKSGYAEADVIVCDFNGIPDVNLVLLEKPLQ